MPPRIAVFTKNRTNPAYDAARLGADRTAARLGATTVHYVPEKPDSVPEQIALIARAIAERPDAAVFVPVDETAVNDAILGFDAARIPLFNIITRTTAGRRVTFVGSDDRALAQEHRALSVRASCRGRGTIIDRRRHARLRDQPRAALGFQDALAEHPGIKVRLLAARRLPARRRPRRLPRRAGINGRASTRCCAPTTPWRSACWTRSSRTRAQRPLVVGVNAIPEAVAAIAAGRMLATADFDAMTMSEIATEAAVRHLRGEAIPAEIMLPVQVVDAANCAAWNAPFEARPEPDWEAVTRGLRLRDIAD